MSSPTATARRRTRWIQGSIIVPSAVVVVFAVTTIATRGAKPTDETPPSAVPRIQTSFAESSIPASPSVDEVVEQPVVAPLPLEQPVTVEAPASTSMAPVPAVVTYENCAAVWASLGHPIHRGDPGYNSDLDTDGDGIGCEQQPRP